MLYLFLHHKNYTNRTSTDNINVPIYGEPDDDNSLVEKCSPLLYQINSDKCTPLLLGHHFIKTARHSNIFQPWKGYRQGV
jgi:hypothetical protein